MTGSWIRASLFFAGAIACNDARLGVPCANGETCAFREVSLWAESPPSLELDLLVVLDDSVARGPYAEDLRRTLRGWGDAGRSQGVDLHMALVSSRGGPGCTRLPPFTPTVWPRDPRPGCPVPPGAFVVSSNVCGRVTPVEPPPGDVLACAAFAGPDPCGANQLLEVMRAVLRDGPDGPALPGFRRPNAYLGVVIVTDEDDQSPAAPDVYSGFLLDVVAQRSDRLLVTIIAPTLFGASGADCKKATISPAPLSSRLAGFQVALDPSFGEFRFVCGDWGARLPLPRLFSDPIRCLSQRLADTDPAAPGLQAACTVTESSQEPDGRSVSNVVGPCSSGRVPCFDLLPDSLCLGSGIRLDLVRSCVPPPGTLLRVRCLVE